MRIITSSLLLLVMVVTVSWGQTDELKASTNVANPEYQYRIKNGQGYWMTSHTSPTSNIDNAALFAFFKSSKASPTGQTTYEIYCVTSAKWLSYNFKTTSSTKYDEKAGFVTFSDNQSGAYNWRYEEVDGKDDLGQVYQFNPIYKFWGVYYNAGSYLNWYGGIGANGNTLDNTSVTVGIYNKGAKDDAGSAWILVLDDPQKVIDEYFQWKDRNAVKDGVNPFGRYPVKDQTALATAETTLNNTTNAADALKAVAQCKALYGEQIKVTVGKYYRIYTPAKNTYIGIKGTTTEMSSKSYNANDPTLIWQYVEEGGKYYMKSAYCGLYQQGLKVAGGATEVGSKDESANFTYSLPGESSDGNFPCTLYLGGTKVWVAKADGLISGHTHTSITGIDTHYIEEVSAPTDAMCKAWYQSNKLGLMDTPAKIDYDEGADVVISPNEFASPAEINEHIDILASYNNPQTMQAVHQTYNFFLNSYSSTKDVLSPYVEAVNKNGALISVPYTAKGEWGTIILPFKAKIPEGWTMNTCASIAGNKLVLEVYTTRIEQNTPYIVDVATETIGTTYQFIGYGNGAGIGIYSKDVLRGVLEDGADIPVGGYMLAKHRPTGKMSFVRVAEAYPIAKHKCYVSMESGASESAVRYNSLFFEDTETGIGELTGTTQNEGMIYNMAGQRMNRMQRGLNIVGDRIVIK